MRISTMRPFGGPSESHLVVRDRDKKGAERIQLCASLPPCDKNIVLEDPVAPDRVCRSLRSETIRVLEATLDHSDGDDGKPIAGKNEKTMRNRLRAMLAPAGSSGELSSRSIRFSYPLSLCDFLLKTGASPGQVQARAFACCGHGRRAHVALDTYLCEICGKYRTTTRG
ncbi:hypothetical protein VSR68_37025 [Paraburkholderia phymatum]|uniref:hypothetical protein n=1 Tax=Paraburkholderia phymatum TaxID=148447 RepID=UPI00317D2CED